ncbi:hypothetical protein IX299_002037 [Porphyromonas levii]|nr:hypothetical protein [Porphyromonas levii]
MKFDKQAIISLIVKISLAVIIYFVISYLFKRGLVMKYDDFVLIFIIAGSSSLGLSR